MWLWVADMDYDLNQYKADRREVRERERLTGGLSRTRRRRRQLDESFRAKTRREASGERESVKVRGEKRKNFYTSRKPSKNEDVLKVFFNCYVKRRRWSVCFFKKKIKTEYRLVREAFWFRTFAFVGCTAPHRTSFGLGFALRLPASAPAVGAV